MTTPKVLKHGNRRAERLPNEFRVGEVEVSRVGRFISLRPKKVSYEDALAAVSRFQGRLRRSQDGDQERDWR